MTKKERAALRKAIIAGPGDAPLSPEEAAALMDVSLSWLRRSDVPRASNGVGGVKYLKSECLAYVAARLSHRVAVA